MVVAKRQTGALRPPRLPCRIDLHESREELHAAIFALCESSLPGWAGLSQDDVEFTRVRGVTSNLLVKVAPNNRTLRAVAVKVNGEITDLMVDRRLEMKAVCQLGAQGFGPKVLALFANGRVEEFLDCATLTPPQMRDPSFVPRIAAGLARFHGAGVNLVPKAPGVFATIRRWLAMARGLDFHDEPRREAYEALDFDDLASEVDQTEAACAGAASPLVWGHNDVISGNIIALQRPGFDSDAPDYGGELALIDYEYGGWNPRGFDFGNHFNEYAGFECDYSRYPGRAQKALFFSHYFAKPGGGGPADLGISQLDELCAEADVYSLASHLFWGTWAVVQAWHSEVDFDYLAYAQLRFDEYRRRKQAFMDQAARVFSARS